MIKYEKVVYISHPYGRDEKKQKAVAEIIKKLVKKYPNYLFVSPIHSFSYLYNEVDYHTGLNYCIWLLEKCDEMWVFGDYKSSTGCNYEIKWCENNNIPYKIGEEVELLI